MGKIKHTIQALQELAHHNVLIIDKEYAIGAKKIKCKCKICGKEIYMLRHQLVRKTAGCKECENKIRFENMQLKLKERDIIISGEYTKSNAKISCECVKCNHRWNTTWDYLRNGSGCPKCCYQKIAEKIRNDKNKLDLSKIDKNILVDISKYINNKAKLPCECRVCGYKWNTSWNILSRGRGCKICGYKRVGNKLRRGVDGILGKLPQANPKVKLLSTDYKSAFDKLYWECKECGNKFYMTWNVVSQGSGCHKCARKRIIKALSYNLDIIKEKLKTINKDIEIVDTQYVNSCSDLLCKCLICGKEYKTKWGLLSAGHGTCPHCNKITSQLERDFLSNFQGWQKDRTILNGKELDAYFADKKIAIEINGAFWHSEEQGKDRDYHLQKTKECEANDIKLFHFFDSELVDKADICKSMIDNALGNTAQIYARNCEVSEISAKEAREFCIENHIQGACIDKVRFGLFYDGELVSVMTFGKSRYDKKFEWELLRFCNKAGYSVVGGASKLLKAFELSYNPKNLISYGNRRWCNTKNNVYATLGFECKGETLPNYFYEKAGKCYNRQTFQRHKLNKAFDYEFSPILTEKEIMGIYGFSRVYDCGNLIYAKDF